MGRARDMRLLSDYQKITLFANKFPFLTINKVEGMPPVEYLLEFKLKGYLNAQSEIANVHTLKLTFPEQYPFSAPPKFAFVKGLFHPNVYKNGDVCHGWYLNNWHPGIHIDDLLMDITKMICFKPDSYNLKSPANYACDADWIATHTIPADDITLFINNEENQLFTAGRQDLNVNELDLPGKSEADNTDTNVKVTIKSIRNVLTLSDAANQPSGHGSKLKVQIN